MQSISLVPSTAYNNSIYIAEKKNCDGGVIVLEDRITEYYMDVQSTTAVSVDMRLLHQLPNSALKFTLIVYSTGNNVLNLSGFNVEQIQVWNGKSVFTVMKGVGDANWNIQMTSSDVRPEQWLRCNLLPRIPKSNTGIWCVTNLYCDGDNSSNLLNEYSPGQNPGSFNYGSYSKNGSTANIYAKFPMPIWLKSVYIGISTNTNISLNDYPIALQIYGSNDGVEWTQILNESINVDYGILNSYTCTTSNYYTFFRFIFTVGSNSTIHFPSISLSGFISELINTGAFSLATPLTGILPINGYNIETNSSDMSEVTGIITDLTAFVGTFSYYKMTRNTNVPWEYIFTFPEAIRTIGFMFKSYNWSDGTPIKLFSLSYSDDKENWTEYCKVDGALNAWNAGTGHNQLLTYFYDSGSEHRYYKITVYSLANGSNSIELGGLEFLQFQKGLYFSFESFVPKLSSNTQAGYMLIASNSSEGDAYKLFDQSVTSYGGGQIADGEWSLMISLPEATVVRGLEMLAPPSEVNRMPYAFSLQGSQDNDTWTNIKSFMLGSNYWSSGLQIGQWDVENETAYKYYRLIVTNTAQGSYIRIGELGLSSYASFKGVDWYEDEYLVPVMSDNSQDGYVASAKSSFDSSYQPWKAFDRTNNSGNDCWACSDADKTNSNKECNVWLQIQLPTAEVFNLLNIVSRQSINSQAPSSFTLKGSNDNETWTDLLTVINESTYSDKTWNFENSTAYSYYRIDIVKTNSANDHVSVAELNFIKRIHHESN